MPRLIDATKWEEFYKEMTDGLKPYDHYDDGYRDAMDNVDDWMDGNQVEAEPVRHGRWIEPQRLYYGAKQYECSLCYSDIFWKKHSITDKYPHCPNCGCLMDGGNDE